MDTVQAVHPTRPNGWGMGEGINEPYPARRNDDSH